MAESDHCGCPLGPQKCPPPDFALLDPRLRHVKKRPRTAPQFVRLAQDVAHLGALVHARLDNLGAPRTLDGAELTLLGRLDLWLDDVEIEFTTARVLRNMHAAMEAPRPLRSKADYMALPGVVAVAERGPCDVGLFVEPAMTTAEFDALVQIVRERRQVNVIVKIERDRRSAERRAAMLDERRATKTVRTPVVGEKWRRRRMVASGINLPVGAYVHVTESGQWVVFGGPLTRGTWQLSLNAFLNDFERVGDEREAR